MDNLTAAKAGNHPQQTATSRAAPSRVDANQLAGLLKTDEALLRIEQLQVLANAGRSTIWDRVRAGTMPKPVRIGTRCTRWKACEIRAWLASQQ